jgi:8-oxo-dGTP pyrophosphatase MutT (NUDIX family)
MEKRNTSTQHSQPVMYCNNCGGKGHLFKTCKDPVLSCGILLIDKPSLPVNSHETSVLMIRRKDSMSFAEFMRGKYEPDNIPYVSTLIKNMTLKEQASVASDSFESLWRQMWGDDRMTSDYLQSREKFHMLDRGSLMRNNISDYTEPEWGFPKGRRMRGESDLACAIREFDEETNIPRDSFVVLKNIILTETFMGLNNVQYKHVYFVALLTDPSLVNLTQKLTPVQRREISGIGWKTFPEAQDLVRPHHVERRNMLEQLQSVIETFESE